MSIETQLECTGVAEVIVVLDDAAPVATASSVSAHFRSSELSRDSALLAALYDGAPPPQGRQVVRHYKHLNIMYGTVDPNGLASLRQDPRVQKVEEAPAFSLIRPVSRVAAKAASGLSWGLQRLRVQELWTAGFAGEGVLVGHLDTGVDSKHPALKGVVKHYAEFDLMGELIEDAKPRDSDDHGTHTAGTIAGQSLKGVSFGAAPGAKLASAMVIEGGNVIARILGGMDWVVGKQARVLSMSLGLRGYTPAFLALTKILRKRNVIPVFAVGNEGPGTSRSAGNYGEALSVGACDDKDRVADFSSSQRFTRVQDPIVPDVVGPGVGVVSCVPNNGFVMMNGTSMATPHIAGLAAILVGAKPNATVDQVETAIFQSCNRPAHMSVERGNRGIPDGVLAYQHLTGSALPSSKPKGKGNGKSKPAGKSSKRK